MDGSGLRVNSTGLWDGLHAVAGPATGLIHITIEEILSTPNGTVAVQALDSTHCKPFYYLVQLFNYIRPT
ncbi:hypothetical protein BGZ80_007339, partial [Entomortierella chlamydospora]